MRKPLYILLLLFFASAGKAQNASPLGGVGSLQFHANDGTLLTSGVVYLYNAGTSTQATVYVDSTGTTTQPNPVTFGSGARAAIWLANGTFVKVVLCVQNDGAFCAAGDILFSADQVPIGSSGGGGGGSPFTGIFISSTASPATSGTLRLASGDSVCWRNAAGSANLCFKKDSNDLLSWDGGAFKMPEINCSGVGGIPGFDIICFDNTAHRAKALDNAGTLVQYVHSGNDIGTTDQVLGVHFSATQETFSSTAPTSGQFLRFDGTNISGISSPVTAYLTSTYTNASSSMTNVTGLSFAVAANTKYSVACNLVWSTSASGNGIVLQWTGPASPTFVTYDGFAELTSAGTFLGQAATAFSTTLALSGTQTASFNMPLRLSMTLSNGANAGTIQLQAQNSAAGTTSILPGSCVLIQ